MDKLFTFALAIAVSLGTTAMLANRSYGTQPIADAQLAPDGAFRDGLYVGQLAAESGRPPHAPAGRWSSGNDRTSFVAGYQRGYNDFLASAR
jgi:hypothetical protein